MEDRIAHEQDTAARYRKRAEELRAIAQFTKGDETSAVLFEIAADYERMAAMFESLDRQERDADRRRGWAHDTARFCA